MAKRGVLSVSYYLPQVLCCHCDYLWIVRQSKVNFCPRCRKNLLNDGHPVKIKLPKIKCPKCTHTWSPRSMNLKECPKCKIPLKNTKKIQKEKS